MNFFSSFFQKFLPTFKWADEAEKEETLRKLFARENIRFGNPLEDFHQRLKSGYFRPDIARMHKLLRRALCREYK